MHKIYIKKLFVRIGKQTLLDGITLDIDQGSFIVILGETEREKKALLLALSGFLSFKGDININGIPLTKKSSKRLRKQMEVVLEDSYQNFMEKTVRDEMMYTMRNKGFSIQDMQKKVEEIAESFQIKDLLDQSLFTLTDNQKQVIALLSATLHNPSLLLLENPFSRMDAMWKRKMAAYLKKLNKKQTTILLFTSDVDDILYGKEFILFKDEKIQTRENIKKIIEEEKNFQSIGYNLPFMSDLSHKLSYYNLVKEPLLNMKGMVKHLWKSSLKR